MNKKEIKKKFEHKWWEHLFHKYKYIEAPDCYKEYEKLRLWVVLIAWAFIIVLSPIITAIALLAESKEWLCFQTGKNGTEKFTFVRKEGESSVQ